MDAFGAFVQSGGSHTTSDLTIGRNAGSDGRYTLGGAGKLKVYYSGGTLTANINNRRRFNLNLAGGGEKVVTGVVTNELTGIVKVNAGRVRWNGQLRNRGVYRSDPSENLFATLIVEETGYLEGGSGDLFSIGEDFISSSTQGSLWNTMATALAIDSRGLHRLDFAGVFRRRTRGPDVLAMEGTFGPAGISTRRQGLARRGAIEQRTHNNRGRNRRLGDAYRTRIR